MFKVGQLIQSTQMDHLDRLTVLNPSFVYKVNKCNSANKRSLDVILIKILPLNVRYDELAHYIGSRFSVEAKYFKLYGAMKPISTIRIK